MRDQSGMNKIMSEALLETSSFETFDEFLNYFPGMTCDFCDAEREGFTVAVKNHYGLSDKDIQKSSLEKVYRFCDVHFKRSATRVRRNGAVIPSHKETH